MAIADWIREATERRRQRVIEEVRSSEEYRQRYAEGFRQGYDEEYHQGLVEGYDMGYDDADKGRPFGFSLDALDNKPSGKRKAG